MSKITKLVIASGVMAFVLIFVSVGILHQLRQLEEARTQQAEKKHRLRVLQSVIAETSQPGKDRQIGSRRLRALIEENRDRQKGRKTKVGSKSPK